MLNGDLCAKVLWLRTRPDRPLPVAAEPPQTVFRPTRREQRTELLSLAFAQNIARISTSALLIKVPSLGKYVRGRHPPLYEPIAFGTTQLNQ